MFFSETLDRTMINDNYRYNLILFKEIERFWNMRYTYGWHITIVNLLGNVICFMPFGFLLPTISRKRIFKNFLSVTLLTFMFSLCIETAQLLMKVGAFDVDDLFLNTIGGFLGYILMKLTKVRKHI
jgi:glycopeptide antibiotics resistance protein